MMPRLLQLLAALALLAAPAPAATGARVELKVDTAQAEAVLDLVEKHAVGTAPAESDWERLFSTEPYLRLERREASLGRPFSRDDFRAFALSPDLAARAPALRRTLEAWRRADLDGAAGRILPYLPVEARIRARVYPVIKPRSNSFVFEVATDPAIFLYLDPGKSEAEFANTVAHELHHVGLASLSSAIEERLRALPDHARQAASWMGAFGEGVAVLAAAGAADVHPLLAFPEADRRRWDQDLESFDQNLGQLDRFFLDLVSGGFARPEVADHVAFTFFGYRGPWYTVGYRMAAIVERRLGRAALVECMADPRLLLVRYNQVAAETNASGGPSLPLWSAELLSAVGAAGGAPGSVKP
jgi:hypothetical protein